MAKILTAGEPLGLFIAQEEGPLESVPSFSSAAAGAEFNVAVGLARLGHAVSYLTRVGDDPFGRKIQNVMRGEKIDDGLAAADPGRPTGFMLKGKVSSGDPEVFYFRRGSAASALCPADVDKIDFSGYRFLHLTGILPALSETARGAAFRLAEQAKRHGLTVFFDPNLRPRLWKNRGEMVSTVNGLAGFADYFLPGEKEISALTGLPPRRAAEFYLRRGVRGVVCKAGPRGAYAVGRDGCFFVPNFVTPPPVDTVGAGDGFAVGVISALAEGLPLRRAVLRGNAIGSLQTLSPGDNEGLPTRPQLERFIASHRLTGRAAEPGADGPGSAPEAP